MEQEYHELTIKPYHIEKETNSDINSPDYGKRHIRIWSTDRESKPKLLIVLDFPASITIFLPLSKGGRPLSWNSSKARIVYDAIINQVRKNDKDFIIPYDSSFYGRMKKLYGYQLPERYEEETQLDAILSGRVRSYPCITMYFRNEIVMFSVVRILNKQSVDCGNGIGRITLVPCESEIDTINKLLTIRGIRHCYWITTNKAFKVESEEHKISTIDEYIVPHQSINRVDPDICKDWRTHLGQLSIDIECYSPNHNKFPYLWDPKCVAYMCTCNYRKNKDSSVKLILMGDCNDVTEIPNTEILRVKSEIELVQKLKEVTDYYDPEIITGFRISSFDIEYLDARLAMRLSKWDVFGRLKGRTAQLIKGDMQSGAYGFNKIYHFFAPGRIVVDAYQFFRREFKYPEYNLNYISKKLLGDQKDDVSAVEMFEIYELMLEGLRKEVGHPLRIEALNKMTKVALYCIQDAALVLRLFDKVSLLISMEQMANVMCVNMYDLYTRGQQIRVDNQLYEIAFTNGYVLNKQEDSDIPFIGGKVQKSKPGFYKRVLTIDFQSLYPSIIDANNVCYTTFVRRDLWHVVPKELCNVIAIDCTEHGDDEGNMDDNSSDDEDEQYKRISKGKKGKYEFRFIKAHILRGLLPRLVTELMTKRQQIQAIIKKLEELGEYDVVLDKQQLAYKVSANSIFGFTGTRGNGRRPFIEASVSITGWGREYITDTINYVVNNYNANVIYGDTDSIMFTIDDYIKDSSQCQEYIVKICEEVTQLFPKGIVMKPEHSSDMLSIMKKKYAMLVYDKKGNIEYKNGKPVMMMKGILPVRRDNCLWARETYEGVLDMIMFQKPFEQCIHYLVDRVAMMIEGRVPYKQLLLNRSVSATYKNQSYFMKIFSDRLRAMGKQVEPGERLYYLVEYLPDIKLIGNKMMLEEHYLEGDRKIDYVYYIKKVLMKHIDSIVQIGYSKEISELYHITYRRKKRSIILDLGSPVRMMCEMIEGNDDINKLKKRVTDGMNGIIEEKKDDEKFEMKTELIDGRLVSSVQRLICKDGRLYMPVRPATNNFDSTRTTTMSDLSN